MSITLELTELSPELEKQLASLPDEERGKFAAALMEKGRLLEEDPAVWACSIGVEKRRLTEEEGKALLEAMNAPAQGPTEAMKAAIQNYKRLTGRSKDLPTSDKSA